MKLTNKEIENIGRLLLSADDSNVKLGLGLLEHNQYAIPQLKKEIEVYLSFNAQNKEVEKWMQSFFPSFVIENHPLYALYLVRKQAKSLDANFVHELIKIEDEYEHLLAQKPVRTYHYAFLADYVGDVLSDKELCIKYYRKAAKYHPTIAWIQYNVANVLTYKRPASIELKDCKEEIIQGYTNAYSLQPKPNTLFALALFYKNKAKDTEQSEIHYQACVQAHPNFPQGWNGYAMLLKEDGRYTEALQKAQTALDLQIKNDTKSIHHTYDTLGYIYWKGFGKIYKAESYFKKAIEHNPTHDDSLLGARNMFVEIEDYPKVIRWQKKLIKAYPYDLDFRNEIVAFYRKTGNDRLADVYEREAKEDRRRGLIKKKKNK